MAVCKEVPAENWVQKVTKKETRPPHSYVFLLTCFVRAMCLIQTWNKEEFVTKRPQDYTLFSHKYDKLMAKLERMKVTSSPCRSIQEFKANDCLQTSWQIRGSADHYISRWQRRVQKIPEYLVAYGRLRPRAKDHRELLYLIS